MGCYGIGVSRTAAAAAGIRMEQLLVYKSRDNCPGGPTAESGLTDALALDRLQTLNRQVQAEEISQREYVDERRALLDALR